MRLKSIIIPLAAFVLAGILSVIAARATVSVVEDRSVVAVRDALNDRGLSWASVLGDGLQIVIEGEAPSEAIRFRAVSAAGGVVDASRVIDNMSVEARAAIAPPDFAIEILRNTAGISLIGLVPSAIDRDELAASITRIARGAPVTDLLEVADYPVPDGWNRALSYALTALEVLPQSKVSVRAGHVDITAISGSRADQRALETRLRQLAPQGLRLTLSVSAPRPVITPFTVRFVLDARGARFEACSADTAGTQSQIVAAARAAGTTGEVTCRLGLGVPTRTWGDAVEMSIAAVAELGGGTLTFADTDISLVAPETTDPDDFERIAGELSNRLPDVFALDAVRTEPLVPQPGGPPQFSATLSPEGSVQLRGRVPDELMNTTARNFAEARFGTANVVMGTRIVAELPRGWSVRVLAALEALSQLENGAVLVEPDRITVRGVTGNAAARDEISALMIDKFGADADFTVDVTYDEDLDPLAALPTAQECIADITGLTATRKISFDPGATTLNAAAGAIVNDIADILRDCIDIEIEIAGFTDSQGREESNARLSQQRADAVLAALRSRRVPVASLTAVGYGEAQPIADNGTEDGREANRRIEFRLVGSSAEPETPAGTSEDDEALWPDDAVGGAFEEGTRPGKTPRARPDDIDAAALAAVQEAEAAAEAAGVGPPADDEAAPVPEVAPDGTEDGTGDGTGETTPADAG